MISASEYYQTHVNPMFWPVNFMSRDQAAKDIVARLRDGRGHNILMMEIPVWAMRYLAKGRA